MLCGIRPSFEVVEEGRILNLVSGSWRLGGFYYGLSFLVSSKGSGVSSYFAKLLPSHPWKLTQKQPELIW